MTATGSPDLKSLARWTGWLYVLIILTAGFSQGVVRESVLVPGDAATTVANIVASETLFRVGLITDLVAFLADAVVAVLLYVLLRPVNRTLSMIAAALRLVAHPAIATLNLLNHWLALQFATGGAGFGAFDPTQLAAFTHLALEAHATGYLLAGAFFGLHLGILGYLLHRSDHVPSWLGWLVAIAGVGYLVETGGKLLLPGYDAVFTTIVAVTAVLGEVTLALYLVIKGVRQRQDTTA